MLLVIDRLDTASAHEETQETELPNRSQVHYR